MAFVGNSLNFPNLTTKTTPVSGDILLLADSAASNALKQCTVGSLPASGGASALTLIATATITSSTASVAFANDLTSTYDNYLILGEGILDSSFTQWYGVFGTGATPTYQTTNYYNAYVRTAAATTVSGQANSTAQTNFVINSYGMDTANPTSFNATISNVNNSTLGKNIQGMSNLFSNTNTLAAFNLDTGYWAGSTVLTSVKFTPSSGTISKCVLYLYGYSN